MEWLILLMVCGAAYFLGSLPTAYWMGKWKKGIDIREHGSGNVGATNAFRVMGKLTGLGVLLIDVAKGTLSVTLLPALMDPFTGLRSVWMISVLGMLAIIGHIWTPFLRFKGGKGVATSLGVFLFLDPVSTLIALGVWIVVFLLFRYVSVSSMSAAVTLPIVMVFFLRPFPIVLIASITCIIICYRHKSNLQKLLLGTEKKIGKTP
ncbi:MAG: glycerol-3-phosphate 1-O-acyltransferase PlsY [Candidatus Omnitrophica bacterium]|nr:glycerol-3-phosphate 1-O-acyltransferase PlsY [Candidatus Omnitrophota bacterium]